MISDVVLYQRLMAHRGHKVVIVGYGGARSMALECEECGSVVLDADQPENVCPNCGDEHTDAHFDSGCYLGMLMAVVRDRHGEVDVARVMDNVDATLLWEHYGGPAADYVEECAGIGGEHG